MDDPDLRLVDTTFGYVSLFPLLLRILQPDNINLGILITDIKNPELLWTKFGLRSLASTSPLYMKRNTEHDAPYWRGPIWININYLTLKSLYYYSNIDGPYQNNAKETYKALRKNLVNNILVQYNKTGFIWEQYNDKTGQGQGSRPFNGWSSLVVLMMAEIY
jgi:mannosyl-oligosaccharide glucosidase